MSQRKFTNNGYEVLTGYDRPLNYFFLVVYKDDEKEFSNLDFANPAMTLDEIDSRLRTLGIEYPTNLLADLLNDKHLENKKENSYIFVDYDNKSLFDI